MPHTTKRQLKSLGAAFAGTLSGALIAVGVILLAHIG